MGRCAPPGDERERRRVRPARHRRAGRPHRACRAARAGAPPERRRHRPARVLAALVGGRGDRRRRRHRPRALAAPAARAPQGRVTDEDHDRAARAEEARPERHRHGRQVRAARPARPRGPARGGAREGVEALLLDAPLFRKRRCASTRDRGGRRQVDVRARDERRGASPRPARHALHLAERGRRSRQLLECVGHGGVDARRATERALRQDRAHEDHPRAVERTDLFEDLRQTTT